MNVNINIGHENYPQCKFYVYVSTDATADAVSCSIFASFILALEKTEPNIWMHIKHCLNSAKTIAIQETQTCIVLMQLHLMLKIFGSDTSGWLASLILFENFCSKIFWTTMQDVYNIPHTFYLVNEP